mmetsp:Transcript_21495/g.27824  ORF Transcript_21495/g.27824 Transcript_21495/m.27824 type:complete len:200 (+) Transcript_21495:418-1017(+)
MPPRPPLIHLQLILMHRHRILQKFVLLCTKKWLNKKTKKYNAKLLCNRENATMLMNKKKLFLIFVPKKKKMLKKLCNAIKEIGLFILTKTRNRDISFLKFMFSVILILRSLILTSILIIFQLLLNPKPFDSNYLMKSRPQNPLLNARRLLDFLSSICQKLILTVQLSLVKQIVNLLLLILLSLVLIWFHVLLLLLLRHR